MSLVVHVLPMRANQLPTGGSMDYRYILQLYLVKSPKIRKPLKIEKKINTDFESCKVFDARLTKSKNNPILLN
jgi:hypothetical protein